MSDSETTKQNVRKLPSSMASMSLKRNRDSSEPPERNVRPRDEEHDQRSEAFATEYFTNAALAAGGQPVNFGVSEPFKAGPTSTAAQILDDPEDFDGLSWRFNEEGSKEEDKKLDAAHTALTDEQPAAKTAKARQKNLRRKLRQHKKTGALPEDAGEQELEELLAAKKRKQKQKKKKRGGSSLSQIDESATVTSASMAGDEATVIGAADSVSQAASDAMEEDDADTVVPDTAEVEKQHRKARKSTTPIVDLLCRDLPYPAIQHQDEFIHKVLEGIHLRHQIQPLTLRGRTSDSSRRSFDPEAQGSSSIREHLLEMFHTLPAKGQNEVQDRYDKRIQINLLRDTERALYHLVCWNTSAFPELTAHQPDRYPGLFASTNRYSSVLNLLRENGLVLRPFTAANGAMNAQVIFSYLQDHVLQKTPSSKLLHHVPWQSDPPPVPERRKKETDLDFAARKHTVQKAYWEAHPSGELSLTTHAGRKSFYTLLLSQTAQTAKKWASAGSAAEQQKIEEAVEVLVYRLMLKEPAAFAEVLSALKG